MRHFFRWFLFRVKWRLAISTFGFLMAEYDLDMMPAEQRLALRAVCFTTIIASIASWQDEVGKHIPRPPRKDGE